MRVAKDVPQAHAPTPLSRGVRMYTGSSSGRAGPQCGAGELRFTLLISLSVSWDNHAITLFVTSNSARPGSSSHDTLHPHPHDVVWVFLFRSPTCIEGWKCRPQWNHAHLCGTCSSFWGASTCDCSLLLTRYFLAAIYSQRSVAMRRLLHDN